jgi:hypothetical protein
MKVQQYAYQAKRDPQAVLGVTVLMVKMVLAFLLSLNNIIYQHQPLHLLAVLGTERFQRGWMAGLCGHDL